VTGLPDLEGRGIYADILKFIRFQLTKARGSC